MSTANYKREITLPVAEGRVLVLNKQAAAPRTAQFRHLGKTGQTSPATVKWQESDDGVNYTDIAGTAQVIDAGQATAWLLSSTKSFVALVGYGNIDIEIDVGRSDPDSPLPQTANF